MNSTVVKATTSTFCRMVTHKGYLYGHLFLLRGNWYKSRLCFDWIIMLHILYNVHLTMDQQPSIIMTTIKIKTVDSWSSKFKWLPSMQWLEFAALGHRTVFIFQLFVLTLVNCSWEVTVIRLFMLPRLLTHNIHLLLLWQLVGHCNILIGKNK